VKRSCQVTLFVVARRDDFGLFDADHPAWTDLGVQTHVDFIVEDHRFIGRQMK
jgi:hypothetical protein